MKTLNSLILSLVVVAVIGCDKQEPAGTPSQRNPEAEKAALQAARTWLALVDQGDFAKSHQESAAIMRSSISQGDWEAKAKLFRTPLGKLVSREVLTQQYATSMPGAPDGEYVMIQFNTKFENKQSAVETVTPMLDKDGTWKVAGYYIK